MRKRLLFDSDSGFRYPFLPFLLFFDSLFERSEFLIDTSPQKDLSVCSTNLGFSVGSANRIRPKHGIPLPV